MSKPRTGGGTAAGRGANGDGRERVEEWPGMKVEHDEQFIGEAIIPAAGAGDATAMARGEPGLPSRFTWRGREYSVAGVIAAWKSTGPCRSGGGEVYLRRHWFRVLTAPPAVMTLYCDRQGRIPKRPKSRWFLYTLQPAGPGERAEGPR